MGKGGDQQEIVGTGESKSNKGVQRTNMKMSSRTPPPRPPQGSHCVAEAFVLSDGIKDVWYYSWLIIVI